MDDTTPFDTPQGQHGEQPGQPWWQQAAGMPARPGGDPWSGAADPRPGDVGQRAPRRPRRVGTGLAALLVAAGLVVGVGGGHLVWSPSSTSTTAAGSTAGTSTAGNPSGSSSAGGAGAGTAPVLTIPGGPSAGSADSGSADFGSADSGSAGSGSTGSSATGPVASTVDGAAIAARADAGIVDVDVQLGYEGAEGAGTGIVLSSDGLVLTNNHVIDGATQISVQTVTSGRRYPATVVGYDASRDVALLQLQGASGLTPANLGTSADLSLGQAVVGVGNGGGTDGTPSWVAGRITGLDQNITASDDTGGGAEQLSGLVETDLAIVPGYSGGPLLDGDGTVVGMDTAAAAANSATNARYGRGRTSSGVAAPDAYAIGIDDALAVAHQIQQGVTTGTVHVGETAFLGIGVDPTSAGGAGVAQVISTGAAAKAGLVVGDTITSLDGQQVTNGNDLAAVMSTLSPGHEVRLTVVGATGAQRTLTVTPAAGPAQ